MGLFSPSRFCVYYSVYMWPKAFYDAKSEEFGISTPFYNIFTISRPNHWFNSTEYRGVPPVGGKSPPRGGLDIRPLDRSGEDPPGVIGERFGYRNFFLPGFVLKSNPCLFLLEKIRIGKKETSSQEIKKKAGFDYSITVHHTHSSLMYWIC